MLFIIGRKILEVGYKFLSFPSPLGMPIVRNKFQSPQLKKKKRNSPSSLSPSHAAAFFLSLNSAFLKKYPLSLSFALQSGFHPCTYVWIVLVALVTSWVQQTCHSSQLTSDLDLLLLETLFVLGFFSTFSPVLFRFSRLSSIGFTLPHTLKTLCPLNLFFFLHLYEDRIKWHHLLSSFPNFR